MFYFIVYWRWNVVVRVFIVLDLVMVGFDGEMDWGEWFVRRFFVLLFCCLIVGVLNWGWSMFWVVFLMWEMFCIIELLSFCCWGVGSVWLLLLGCVFWWGWVCVFVVRILVYCWVCGVNFCFEVFWWCEWCVFWLWRGVDLWWCDWVSVVLLGWE